jgi:hypothetical protein
VNKYNPELVIGILRLNDVKLSESAGVSRWTPGCWET